MGRTGARQSARKKKSKQLSKNILIVILVLLLVAMLFAYFHSGDDSDYQDLVLLTDAPDLLLHDSDSSTNSSTNTSSDLLSLTPAPDTQSSTSTGMPDSLADIPLYSGEPYVELQGNVPNFDVSERTTEVFETYAPLDELGRCGVAYANICTELMPEDERGDISKVKPSGFKNARYDGIVEGGYLYNRCHLIGYQLAGENANPCNLITGTRYLNIKGMLPFENLVTNYVRSSNHHVLYRVTPLYNGDDLVAYGVVMEAQSVEDDEISYHIFAYNVQPGIVIDYATGDSWIESDSDLDSDDDVFDLLDDAA